MRSKREEKEVSSPVSWRTKVHYYQSRVLIFLKNASGYRIVRVFRKYSAFSIVASSALLVSATNVTQGKGFNEVLSGYMGAADVSAGEIRRTNGSDSQNNLAMVKLASNIQALDPGAKDETSLFDVEQGSKGDTVVASAEKNIAKDPEEDGGVSLYTVKEGDSLSVIASNFDITINTILWANDIANEDEIQPGDQIFILPVAGLTHVVKSGDTIDDIAKKYKVDKQEIIAYNQLPANGSLTEGESIVVPGGEKEEAQPVLERRQYAGVSGGVVEDISNPVISSKGKPGTGHRFPYGYCTWYVAQKRYVPWGGNAGAWLANAKALGYKTGKKPVPGAIVVTTENRYYGHVAYVEKVSGGTITVTDMNYAGWGKTTRRTLSADSRVIRGYIY